MNELGPMIDSGAHTSVCPPSFVASSPVMPGRNIQLVSVTGEPLQIIGEKVIELEEKQLDQKVVKNFARFTGRCSTTDQGFGRYGGRRLGSSLRQAELDEER